MASWSEIEAEAPELAARAHRIFDRHIHKTLATLRRDGSPRISGTEIEFRDGQVYLGSMWGAMKALDLRRDPRFAIHSASTKEMSEGGDAKIAGRVEEVTETGASSHRFRADITELVITSVSGDRLVIESWHQDRGLSRRERR
jgi:hypothetical protein